MKCPRRWPWKAALALLLLVMILAPSGFPELILLALGIGTFAILLLAARERLGSEDPPNLLQISLGVAGALLLGLGLVTSAAGARFYPERSIYQTFRFDVGLGLLCALGLSLVPWRGLWTWLMDEGSPGPRVEEPLVERPRWASAAIVVTWLVVHGSLWASYPPLLMADSWCNVYSEPTLFRHLDGQMMHHLPLYSVLVKLFAWEGGALVVGLSILTVLQHALVLATAFAGDRLVRRATGSPVAAALFGVGIAFEAHVATYAQLVMTEVVGLSLATFALAALVEAQYSKRPLAWVSLSGGLACCAIMTRHAFQLWVVLLALWIVFSGFKRRARLVTTLLVCAWAPLGLVLAHNAYFLGRAQLTESGRFLVYRLAASTPLPSEEEAARDPDKLALRLIVLEKDRLWVGPYERLREEFDWSDAEYTREVRRLWIQMVLDRPLRLTRDTLRDSWVTYRSNAADVHLAGVAALHQGFVKTGPWSQVPLAPTPGPLRVAWAEWSLSTLPPILLFAILGLFPVPGKVRGVGLLALLSASYLLVLPCLIVYGVGRFRVPAVPFLFLSAALGVANCLAWGRLLLERARPGPAEPGPGPGSESPG